ncbi:MAG: hypothetical protein KAV82_02830 [Phycisphaerae bacterium]|nr:hypothetical protein [Phycisphaerae bacterium]
MTGPIGEHITEGAKVGSRRALRVRRGLLRGVLLLVVVGVVYAVAVVWHRDTVRIRAAVQKLEFVQRALQARVDADGRLPMKMPKTDPEGNPLPVKSFTYLTADDIRALREHEGAAMVVYSTPVGAGLKQDGRAVIIYEQGKCRVRWFTMPEFIRQKKQLEGWFQDRQRQLIEQGPQLP